MGRGTGACKKVGGYENPAVAAWAISTALMAVIAMAAFIIAEDDILKSPNGNNVATNGGFHVLFVERAVFIAVACVYTVLFVISGLVTMLGYFLWSRFLCFACPLTIINQLICLLTGGFGGYLLTAAYNYQEAVTEAIRIGAATPVADDSVMLVLNHHALFLLLAVSALACVAPLSRAGTIDENGTMVDVMLHLPVTTACIAMGGMMLLPTRLTIYTVFGSLWLAASLISGLLVVLQKCGGFASRLSAILFVFFYVAVIALSLVCIILVGSYFVQGRNEYLKYVTVEESKRNSYIRNLGEKEYFMFSNFIHQNSGGFDLTSVVISSVILAYSLMGSAFSLRALCGDSSALVRAASSESSTSK